ncbi:DUF1616 domain-containing protein [Chloroflexota bacterium]
MNWINEIFNFILPAIDNSPIIREISGFILVFLLPGFAWTFVLFKRVNYLERLVLSFGLSIALVTLSILLSNAVFKIQITGLNSFIITLIIIIMPIIIYYINKYFLKRKNIIKTTDKSINTTEQPPE